MRCEANCVSGTVMTPALPGKSFGYLVLCPVCKGGAARIVCEPVADAHVRQSHFARAPQG